MAPSLEKGPPIYYYCVSLRYRGDREGCVLLTASPTWPMLPSGLNCLPTAPPDEMTEGFLGLVSFASPAVWERSSIFLSAMPRVRRGVAIEGLKRVLETVLRVNVRSMFAVLDWIELSLERLRIWD